ncbi:unnamed protein product [Phytomonas sp. Hart1]|nr:unnamed protein product [Phytomonas sp. Hart1]|eukprot:CCW68138.1 unnamed protein product [Phytomonas sp. isolate Hart1]
MARISADIKYLGDPDPPVEPKVRMSALRRLFFEDLDSSFKVNPNKINNLDLVENASSRAACENTLRKQFSTCSEELLSSENSSDRQTECKSQGRTRKFHSSEKEIKRASKLRRLSTLSSEKQDNCKKSLGSSKSFCGHFKFTVAALTNIVAGSLAGMAFKCVYRTVSSTVITGIVVIQSLSFMGYATISWRALFCDAYRFVIHGSKAEDSQAAKNILSLTWNRLIFTLSRSAARRAFFWAGFIFGTFQH